MKKKEPTKRVRCKELVRGRMVRHPVETDRTINVGEIVELPVTLAEQLIDRGDFEEPTAEIAAEGSSDVAARGATDPEVNDVDP